MFIGIELDPDYIEIAKARIEFASPDDEDVVSNPTATTTPFDKLFDT